MLMKRRFGVELEAFGVTKASLGSALRAAGLPAEIDRYGSMVTPHWRITPDGSLRGLRNPFELVSPILEGDEGLMDLYMAVKIAKTKGAQVNRACGFHVHVEARDFDLGGFKRLVKSFANNEDIFDAIMPQSRRGSTNRYTRSIFGLTASMTDDERVAAVQRFFDRVDAATTIQELVFLLGDRYMKLNLRAFLEHGTVEFRHHGGTMNPEKVVNWVKFCQAFVEHAHKAKAIRPWGVNRMTKTARLRTMLKMIGALDLYPYYRDRIKELQLSGE